MPRPRREEDREATYQQIKAVARRLMAENGAAGLSIRPIARELGMSPSALYYYFANLDELITALIVDAFNGLADALEAVREESAARGDSLPAQLEAVLLAYRGWALDNPTAFQLIYGTPIPGYEAPREVTVPASARTLVAIAGTLQALLDSGDLVPAGDYAGVPDWLAAHLEQIAVEGQYQLSLHAAYLAFSGWPVLHGIVMLELFGHLEPVVGDTDAFTRMQLGSLMRALGVRAADG